MKQIVTLFVLLLLGMNVEAKNGRFSVAKDHQVEFAFGNLQYCPATGVFRFAKHQEDVLGLANEQVGPQYAGWIDLFGWATSGYDNRANDPDVIYCHPWDWMCRLEHSGNPRNPFGYGPSTTQSEASLVGSSANYDWGVYNAVSNGGKKAGLWRTLTRDEWVYLLFGRDGARQLHRLYDVNGIHGLLLLPDGFEEKRNMTYSQLLNAGAVFLPCGGVRYHRVVDAPMQVGTYWSASAAGNDAAYFLGIYAEYTAMSSELYGRNAGRCVRLVRDVQK